MKIAIATLILIFGFVSRPFAQPSFSWVKELNFGQGLVSILQIQVDGSNNVYICGEFSNSITFDPSGVGLSCLTSNGGTDIFFGKFNSSGQALWLKCIGGSDADRVNSMIVTPAGEVIIGGGFMNTVDFDPDGGVVSLNAGPLHDAFVAKYSTNGALMWVWKNSSPDSANETESLAVDAVGNVYMVAGFMGNLVTQPGNPGSLIYGDRPSIFYTKLNSSGVWQSAGALLTQGLSGQTQPHLIRTDSQGNIYIVGGVSGTVDTDPSNGYQALTTTQMTKFVVKLSPSFTWQWAKLYDGNYLFTKTMEMLPGGDFIHVGTFSGTQDFDPGAGTVSFTSTNSSLDAFAARYSTTTGSLVWAKTWGGSDNDAVNALHIDALSHLQIIGSFSGIVDFDPGAGSTVLVGAGTSDIYMLDLDPNGTFASVSQVGDFGTEYGNGIYKTSTYTYFAGACDASTDFDPGNGIVNLPVSGQQGFICKYSACPALGSAASISGLTSVCRNSTVTYTIPSVTGATNYTWTVPSGASITAGQGTNSVTVLFGTSSGSVSVSPSNACETLAPVSLSITVLALPTFSTQPTNQTVTAGTNAVFSVNSASSGISYQWQVNQGSGFNNVSNGSQYSGATTNTLTVIAPQVAMTQYQFRCVISVANCSANSNAATLVVNSGVSVDSPEGASLRLSPNPARGSIVLEFHALDVEQAAFEVFDIYGKVILSGPCSQGRNVIDLGGLSNGLYFMRVEKFGWESKFVVE